MLEAEKKHAIANLGAAWRYDVNNRLGSDLVVHLGDYIYESCGGAVGREVGYL